MLSGVFLYSWRISSESRLGVLEVCRASCCLLGFVFSLILGFYSCLFCLFFKNFLR